MSKAYPDVPPPAAGAPKAEWDAYRAWQNRLSNDNAADGQKSEQDRFGQIERNRRQQRGAEHRDRSQRGGRGRGR